MESKSERRVEYVVDKVFEADGIAVQVTKSIPGKPYYSVQVGAMRVGKSDGAQFIARYIPIRAQGQGEIRVTPVSGTAHKLLVQAEEYIQSELQLREDEWVERSIAYAEKKDSKEKPRPRRGLSGGPGSGKTQRRREAKKGIKSAEEDKK